MAAKWWAACVVAMALGPGLASAAEPELVLPAAEPSSGNIAFHYEGQPAAKVLAFGPVALPAAFAKKGAVAEVVLTDVDFGGKATSCELFLVDASRRGPRKVDGSNAFGTFAAYASEPAKPQIGPLQMNDYKVGAAPFRPASHLRAFKQVMVAVVVSKGEPKIGRVVLRLAGSADGEVSVQPSPKPIVCGDKACSGATPVCCLSKGQKTCTAVAGCAPEPSTVPLGCTDPQDCPGQACCLHTGPSGPTYTTCTPVARCPVVSDARLALPMCKTVTDCPPLAGKDKLVDCGTVMWFEQRFCRYKADQR